MKRYQMLIGGEWVDAEGGATFESENPFLGGPWAVVPRATPADVDRAFQASDWRGLSEGAICVLGGGPECGGGWFVNGAEHAALPR